MTDLAPEEPITDVLETPDALEIGDVDHNLWDDGFSLAGWNHSGATELPDLIWEAVEQIDDLAISALDDWLEEWGDREGGLPYAAKIVELKEGLIGLVSQLRDVARDIDQDTDAEDDVALDDYHAANEAINQERLPAAEELLAQHQEVEEWLTSPDTDDAAGVDDGGSFPDRPITLDDLFHEVYDERQGREEALTNLFAEGGIPADSINVEDTDPE